MKKFKLALTLFLGLAFSGSIFVINASDSEINCCGCIGGCGCCCKCRYCNYEPLWLNIRQSYSPEKNFRIYRYEDTLRADDVFFVEDEYHKIIFELKNLTSFSFSKDSRYLLVERSDNNSLISSIKCVQDFIEIFDLVNEKCIFSTPIYKKYYSTRNPFCSKSSYNIDNLVYLNFYGNTLSSLELYFDRNYIFYSINLCDIKYVYVSKLGGLRLLVRFNNDSMRIYTISSDFSRLCEENAFSFCSSIIISDMKHGLEENPNAFWGLLLD